MIKITVIVGGRGRKWIGDVNVGVANFTYMVKLFGIIIHAFTISTDYETAKKMFGKYLKY